MNSENRNEFETSATTTDINPPSSKNECNDTGKVWKKNCPKCGKEQVYTTKKILTKAIRQNRQCNQCRCAARRVDIPPEGWVKHCSECGKTQIYSCRDNLIVSIRKNRSCIECGHNIIPTEKLKRNCPRCNIELKYKRRTAYTNACKLNTECKKCSHIDPIAVVSLVRVCPTCNSSIHYKTPHSCKTASHNNTRCKSCTSKYISEETREKHRMAMRGNNNPSWGKVGYWKGKSRPEEFRRRHRILVLERKEKLGIPHTEDKGAREYFTNLNKTGFDFTPTRFMEIGYEADGYDKSKHIWYEYDTPYHSKHSQKMEDLERQTNIINHFVSVNNPLNKFIRVKVNSSGEIVETINVI